MTAIGNEVSLPKAVATGVAVGYATAWVAKLSHSPLRNISPVAGLVFGVAYPLAARITEQLLEGIFDVDSEVAKTIKYALSQIVGALAGATLSAAVGITLAPEFVVILAIGMIIGDVVLPYLDERLAALNDHAHRYFGIH